jgi:hypothetical protein
VCDLSLRVCACDRRRSRKARHAAAFALVGWYLLMAATFRNPQTDSLTVDLNAPLSAWDFVSSFYSASDCELAEGDLVDGAPLP